MRVLIVGAGIAGLSLAALLKQRGIYPKIVERRGSIADHEGYVLGLYPLGSNVLHGLGIYDKFLKASESIGSYSLFDGKGKSILTSPMTDAFIEYGLYRCCSRGSLISLLYNCVADLDVSFGVTIREIHQRENEVYVQFSNGKSEIFDLVVGADGINSAVRTLAFTEHAKTYDTGWGAWIWWANEPNLAKDQIAECWGAGSFFGLYPDVGRHGVVCAIPRDKIKTAPYEGRRSDIRHLFEPLVEKFPHVFEAMPNDEDAHFFFWELKDVRMQKWSRGRVVLIGDASDGFLPTAGVGASMALCSSAVLADELGRTNARYVKNAIELYEKRRKEKVEKIQNNSRSLAKMMMVKSKPLAYLRNFSCKFYSLKQALKPIIEMMKEPL